LHGLTILLYFLGKGLCIALAQKGLFVTIVDFSEENGGQVASLVQKEATQFHGDSKVPSAISIKCDVTDAGTSISFAWCAT
jgi:NAD(P)-dependent dehydrogenase (short-subunit alcohol dehydrogenase family)